MVCGSSHCTRQTCFDYVLYWREVGPPCKIYNTSLADGDNVRSRTTRCAGVGFAVYLIKHIKTYLDHPSYWREVGHTSWTCITTTLAVIDATNPELRLEGGGVARDSSEYAPLITAYNASLCAWNSCTCCVTNAITPWHLKMACYSTSYWGEYNAVKYVDEQCRSMWLSMHAPLAIHCTSFIVAV